MDELKKKLNKNLEESQAMLENLFINLNEKSHHDENLKYLNDIVNNLKNELIKIKDLSSTEEE